VILLLPPALCELCAEEEVASNSVLCWCCIEAVERLKPFNDRQFAGCRHKKPVTLEPPKIPDRYEDSPCGWTDDLFENDRRFRAECQSVTE
jgi:hypothetical protein